ncbi:hypothetical protein ABZ553_40940 [Streptomyces sparsogenes]|uniref:hypothetical protein n=1 Tax=Streptomyces sparsogenes TaxID=67365 RepID=UPI0033DC28AF
MAERLGQMIVDRCGWGDVTVKWVANDQARLVPKNRAWWIGITVGISVQMWAGRTLDDGTYGDPTAQSPQLWASDHDAVIDAARQLRDQMEDVERPGTVAQWPSAVTRAEEITARDQPVPDSWEYQAIRSILAVTLAGLAHRQQVPVHAVTATSILEHLDRGPSAVCALADELGLSSSSATGPAAEEWAWLTRPWPADPPAANSGGMPRGIGRGLTDPAVLVCTSWAALAVHQAEQPPDDPEE